MSRERQAPPWQIARSLSWDYASGYAIPPHTHEWHQIVYATSGVMTVKTPDGSWVVPAHRAVWVPGRVVHSIAISGRVAMRTLYVRPGRARTLRGGCRVVAVSPLLRELILAGVAAEKLDRRKPAHARLLGLIFDQLQAVEVAALHVPEPSDPRAAFVARRVQQEPGDQRTLEELAEGSGGGARTIERLFKAETGMSFGRWRQQARLAHSLRLLASGRKVTAVALDVGYDSPSAFVTAFRNVLGATPGRYFLAPD